MKYKVYHVNAPNFQPTIPIDFPNEFTKVAEVVCENLEEVFRVTNTINTPWWKNPEVKCHRKTRSTSVGDVVVDENNNHYLCDRAGWKEFK